MARKRGILFTAAMALLLASSLLIGCGGAAPAPTAAPAKPAAPEPTKAPAAPAPTTAAGPARTDGYFKGKSVTVILPNSPGGGNDTTLRYVTPFVQEAAGAQAMT